MSAEGTTPSRTQMAREGDRRIQAKIDAARSAPRVQVPAMEGERANVREQLRRLRPSNM